MKKGKTLVVDINANGLERIDHVMKILGMTSYEEFVLDSVRLFEHLAIKTVEEKAKLFIQESGKEIEELKIFTE